MAPISLDASRLPKHIAVIMDGNSRWAARRGLTREEGHEAGAKSVRAIIEGCREIGISYLTLFAFSTENWRRSEQEVSTLFRLLSKYVRLEIENLHKEGIRVTVMGRREGLPAHVIEDLTYCQDYTQANGAMTVNIAINYGGRAELVDAAKRIAEDVRAGALDVNAISEKAFQRYLYLPDMPDPDLLIRTSGEMRISNFMLWQLSYAEIVPTKVLWPDFRKRHLWAAIKTYQARARRFGGR